MIEFLSGLRQVAREYPWLIAIVTIVMTAFAVVMLDDLRRSLKSHEYTDQKKIAARQAAQNRRELDRQIAHARRAHQNQ